MCAVSSIRQKKLSLTTRQFRVQIIKESVLVGDIIVLRKASGNCSLVPNGGFSKFAQGCSHLWSKIFLLYLPMNRFATL